MIWLRNLTTESPRASRSSQKRVSPFIYNLGQCPLEFQRLLFSPFLFAGWRTQRLINSRGQLGRHFTYGIAGDCRRTPNSTARPTAREDSVQIRNYEHDGGRGYEHPPTFEHTRLHSPLAVQYSTASCMWFTTKSIALSSSALWVA
jgi:hypothetical protein